MLTIIWHLISDPNMCYRDLGADFYQTHVNQRRRERSLISQLEQITGKKVALLRQTAQVPPPDAPASTAASSPSSSRTSVTNRTAWSRA